MASRDECQYQNMTNVRFEMESRAKLKTLDETTVMFVLDLRGETGKHHLLPLNLLLLSRPSP